MIDVSGCVSVCNAAYLQIQIKSWANRYKMIAHLHCVPAMAFAKRILLLYKYFTLSLQTKKFKIHACGQSEFRVCSNSLATYELVEIVCNLDEIDFIKIKEPTNNQCQFLAPNIIGLCQNTHKPLDASISNKQTRTRCNCIFHIVCPRSAIQCE